MNDLKQVLKGFFSRKWLVTVGVMSLAYYIPIKFAELKVDSMITLAALGIITAAGVAYGVLNVKDSKPNGQA